MSTNGSTQQGDQGSRGGDAPALGVGNPTSGEAGSTLTHESMAETGGSGGAQQTLPRKENSMQRDAGAAPAARPDEDAAEGAGSASTAIGRGAQDTRSRQAGIAPDGLGTPETGGNQSAGDLAPPRDKRTGGQKP